MFCRNLTATGNRLVVNSRTFNRAPMAANLDSICFVFIRGGTIKPFCRLVYGGENNHHDWPVMFENLFAQSGLSLDRLKTFREIVSAGGISAAGGHDSNRQSQFSRQL